MRQSQKQNRARSKNGRKSSGPSLNRVYESSGPEGKVRGTPQQIIEKYLSLARDKATSGDRVLSESFLQHAEHYVRVLGAAQTSQGGVARREEPETTEAEFEGESEAETTESGSALTVMGDDEGRADIVETPENAAADRRASRRRSASAEIGEEDEAPKRRRRPQRRQPRGTEIEGGEAGEADAPRPKRGVQRAQPADEADAAPAPSEGGNDLTGGTEQQTA